MCGRRSTGGSRRQRRATRRCQRGGSSGPGLIALGRNLLGNVQQPSYAGAAKAYTQPAMASYQPAQGYSRASPQVTGVASKPVADNRNYGPPPPYTDTRTPQMQSKYENGIDKKFGRDEVSQAQRWNLNA